MMIYADVRVYDFDHGFSEEFAGCIAFGRADWSRSGLGRVTQCAIGVAVLGEIHIESLDVKVGIGSTCCVYMYQSKRYTHPAASSNHVLRVFTLLPVHRARCPRARTRTFFEPSAVRSLALDGKERALIRSK